ncbi:DUF2279 domain-containing protein [Adhaeribacter aquaticus]|uniref:DUF2279 domain-containing protein n=1 Tax=Adhaeribacter aquaticus TaxID=299567 RepID=UPI000428936F|nr:DUF2279 domain-containing protein [Adhaeribacter aquaticus]
MTIFRNTLLLYLFLIPQLLFAQELAKPEPDTTLLKNRLIWGSAALATGYTTSLIVLSNTWYSKADRTSFHFFNDNHEWKQMDKIGHFWGAFHQSRLGVDFLKSANVPEKKAIIWGGLLGVVLQSPIELLDGYVASYGASLGDLGANALGSAAVIAQQLKWGQLRVIPKYSFRPTPFAANRPNVLGSTFSEQLLKDYNGQTYWLSADISAFLPKTSRYPKWLNIAFGYGANGMVHAHDLTNQQAGYTSYRQYYLALDLNLLNIKTQNKFLKGVFYVLSVVHLPAPAVEYNRHQGIRIHPIYF